MKLFYAPGACSLADHIALAEGGRPYSLVKVDLRTKRTEDGQDFATINPKGYVPVLELTDGNRLTENLAILSYIAKETGTLQPADGPDHWKVLEATAFITTELHKGFKPFFTPGASQEQKDEAAAALGKRFATVADMLADRDFVVGDAVSIADCYLFVMLLWARKNDVAVPDRLGPYFDRLKARPAFARALAEEGLA